MTALSSGSPRVPASGERFLHVDALRAMAVIMVVLGHVGHAADSKLRSVPADSGVTVFFVISGFVIASGTLRAQSRGARFSVAEFYIKRLVKLAPPFLLLIALPTLIFGVIIDRFAVDGGAFAGQAFFYFNWLHAFSAFEYGTILPGSEVVWSLGIEEQFYIAFALIWLLLWRTRGWLVSLTVIASVTVVGSFATRVALVDDFNPVRILRGTDTRADAIALGVLGACAMTAYAQGRAQWLSTLGRDRTLVMAVLIGLAGFLPLGDGYEFTARMSLVALTTILVIMYGMFPSGSLLQNAIYRVSALRWVTLIGLSSYSIYLAHYPIIHALLWFDPPVPVLLISAMGGAVGIAAGLVTYREVEVRALENRHRLLDLLPSRRELARDRV